MTGPVTGARWWRVTHASGAAYRIRARDHSTATARANATARSCKPPARVVSICLDESTGATERAIERAQAVAAWRVARPPPQRRLTTATLPQKRMRAG